MVFRILLAFLLLAQELVIAQAVPNTPATRTPAPDGPATRTPAIKHPRNRIDSLITSSDVVGFIRSLGQNYRWADAHPLRREDTIPAIKRLIDRFGIRTFEKADIDGNGLTDLLFNGRADPKEGYGGRRLTLIILAFEKDSFLVKELEPLRTFSNYFAVRILSLDGQPCIQTLQTLWLDNGLDSWNDTLTWRLNAFIEKTQPVKRAIEKIDYKTRLGMSPEDNLTLKITGDSVRLTKEVREGFSWLDSGGVFLTRLDTAISNRLYGLLEQIDFVKLKESYDVYYSDASTGFLHITYDNGREKTINDHGCSGTYGLLALQELLHALAETQNWKRAGPVPQRCIDSIHTDEEALALVRTLCYNYPYLDLAPDTPVKALPDYQQRINTFGGPRWAKADFDGNGHTDLLFNGFYNRDGRSELFSVVVLSFGGDSLVACDLSWGDAFFSAKPIRMGSQDLLAISYLHAIRDFSQKKGYRLQGREDTLTAWNGQLVELPATSPHRVEKLIECEGAHDDKIEFTRDTIWWYKNEPVATQPFKDSLNLYFTVDTAACAQILSFAGSIEPHQLDPRYLADRDDWSFYHTWTFTFDGGKQLKVRSDDVGDGSLSLQALNRLIDNIKRSGREWQWVRPAEEPICNCDHIDSLSSNEQVLAFVRGLHHREFEGFTFDPPVSTDPAVNVWHRKYQQRLDSFGVRPYEKLNLDYNGQTDLLVNGYDPQHRKYLSLLILSFDKDSFLVKELPKEDRSQFFAARTIRVEGNAYLQTLTESFWRKTWSQGKGRKWRSNDSVYLQRRCDTLTWFNPYLVEYPHFVDETHNIDTLRFQVCPGLGGIPLQLTIIGDSLVLDKACEIWHPQTPLDSGGVFTARMNHVMSEQLYGLLRWIRPEQLNKAYQIAAYDASAGNFEIWYDHGKRKTIYDYGHIGTYGLSALQDMLLSLLETQDWTRIGKGGPDYFLVYDLYEYPF